LKPPTIMVNLFKTLLRGRKDDDDYDPRMTTNVPWVDKRLWASRVPLDADATVFYKQQGRCPEVHKIQRITVGFGNINLRLDGADEDGWEKWHRWDQEVQKIKGWRKAGNEGLERREEDRMSLDQEEEETREELEEEERSWR